MRKHLAVPFLMFLACEGSSNDQTNTQKNQQALVCAGSDVPIYRNRFVPQAGASGVATAPEATAGVISSDAVSGGSGSAPSSGAIAVSPAPTSAPPIATSIDGAPTAGTPVTTTTDGAPTGAGGAAGGVGGGSPSITAMDASCGQAPCSPQQVAVEVPPVVAGGTGSATSPAVGATAIGAPAVLTDPPAPASPAPTTSALTAPPAGPTATLVCADPPPDCPQGQSPQFTSKKTWECTDCSLVVTYGGIYGNYRRCVNMPHLDCPAGDVPTWVFEDERWECKTKCDNGQYDQHTVQGLMVCVPC